MSLLPVLALLEAHAETALSPIERRHVEETIRFVRSHPDCLLRTCTEGHLTGSAWILNRERTKTLLTHHMKLDKWLQLGGHADGEPDLLAVALKEANEESGLTWMEPESGVLFDVDRHLIPARKSDPDHYHFDLRFTIIADEREPFVVTHESKALAWVPLGEVAGLNPEESMQRMARKSLGLHRP